jgi:membrane associated rhomboid family serine protease
MTPTSVGMRCPECAGERTRVHRMPQRTPSGMVAGQFVWFDPRTWTAWQTLIFINAVCFIAEVATGVTLSGAQSGWVWTNGVLFGPLMSHGHDEYWRLLTSGFLHESIYHIGINMVSLFFIGRALEPAIGRTKFYAIYFAALLAGSFGALVFSPEIPSLGASGAIFGAFGALIAIAHARRISLWQSGLMPVLLINLVFTLTIPDVSVGAHIGGLVSGLICGRAMVEFTERRSQPRYFYGICAAIAVVAIVGGILVAGGAGIAPNGLTI